MKKIFISACSGLLFGFGLAVSGMLNPSKVLSFLDVFGQWDPTLALVMVGAILVNLPATWLILKMNTPLFANKFMINSPDKKSIDGRLFIGAVFFGVGWGLVGLCPGPATVLLVSGSISVIVFFTAMVVGMWINFLLFQRRS